MDDLVGHQTGKLVKDRYARFSNNFLRKGYKSKNDAVENIPYEGLIGVGKDYVNQYIVLNNDETY